VIVTERFGDKKEEVAQNEENKKWRLTG